MCIDQRLLTLLCSFAIATRAVREGEQGRRVDPKPELEPTLEEVTRVEPIPGSQTWYSVNKMSKSVHTCGNHEYCCIRGCRYLVEQDACGECQGHNVKQLTPAEEVAQYQTAMRNFRIPSGIDYPGPVRGCTKRNAVSCIDKDGKKSCCCNSGFIFDFKTRMCVSDAEDPKNKEEPIPGTESWGLIWGHARKKVAGNPAKKCAWHPKKWCCNRGCEYMLDSDKCGHCTFDEGTSTSPKDAIKKFIAENGNYVIPRSIAKPRANGVCWVQNSKKCVSQGSTVGQCCCHAGFYFSFASRRCLEPGQQQKELEEDEAEDKEAEAKAEAAASEPMEASEATDDAHDDLKTAIKSAPSLKKDSGAGHATLSLALLVFTLPWY